MSAYLLVFHGSRDPRPQSAVTSLGKLVQQQLQAQFSEPRLTCADRETRSLVGAILSPSSSLFAASPASLCSSLPLVGTAALECAPQPLHEQVCQFAVAAMQQGIYQIQVLPLFLLPGVHVKEDIPEQLAIAQQQLGSTVAVRSAPYLGSHPGLKDLLVDRLAAVPADAYILLSHGSRRIGGNEPIETLASQLSAVPAYWSVAPSLETQVQALMAQGHQRLAIFPYFVFAGGIVDAIAQQVTQLTHQFPPLNLRVIAPLEPSSGLAQLVVKMITG